jgi:predicted alpha/beta-hydrolase family hydrolase
MTADVTKFRFAANEHGEVDACLVGRGGALAAYVFAHGAGAVMEHPFLESLARELADPGVATLRFQFPYMQKSLKRPDPAPIAQAAVRAAVIEAAQRLPDVPLFAGGKSFGGRMTSQAQTEEPLPRVVGLIFVGFPFHPAGKPSMNRADHLAAVQTSMLFLQGTRDALADYELVKMVVSRLGERATLAAFEGADHSFHLRGRGTKPDLIPVLAETMSAWMQDRR